MVKLAPASEHEIQKPAMVYKGGSSDSVYGLGFVGALVYYISRARTFQEGVVGFFKAMVWPAILVYEIFRLMEGPRLDEKHEQSDHNI